MSKRWDSWQPGTLTVHHSPVFRFSFTRLSRYAQSFKTKLAVILDDVTATACYCMC